MVNDKDSYIQQLENIVQQSFDALELCALFEERQSVFDNITSIQDLFSQAVEVLQKKIPIQAHAFYEVNEETLDMFLKYCLPHDMGEYLNVFFESLVERGDVAWALREQRLVTVASKDGEYQALLHSLTTRKEIRGLFIAIIRTNSLVINNIHSMLFSIILRSTAFAYENFLLYSRVESQKKELSQTVESLYREIEHKKQIEESLRKSEVMYRNVFENTGNPTIIVDETGNINLANSQFVSFSGYTQQELLDNSKNIFDFFVRESSTDNLDFLFSGSPPRDQHQKREAVFYAKDNVKQHVLLYVYPLGLNNFQIVSLSDISRIKSVEEKLNFQAYHDQLTQLPNRAFLENRLQNAILKATVSKEFGYALLFIDIDRLKAINDTLGHAAGDEMIIAASKKIKSCIRDVDTLARFGGDEFVVLLEGVKEKHACELVMQRMFAEFNNPIELAGKPIFVTFSCGIYLGVDGSSDCEAAIRYSDIAMYKAKNRGRNTHEYYDQIEYGQEETKLYLEQELLRALSTDEIYLHFQPIVDLSTNKITSVEALARWGHPEFGNIPPNEFIPIAENTHLIHPLGMKIFSLAFEEYSNWRKTFKGVGELSLAINMSVKQFVHCGIVGEIQKCAAEHNFPLDKLHIEITESIFMDHSARNRQAIEELNRLGVTITIDDFGTGYSSLTYLNQFTINAVKIDKSIIQRIATNETCQHIVKSMVDLAQKMDLSIVAEGIEDDDQLQILQGLNCQLGQGFYFCRPMPGGVIDSFLVLEKQES